MKPIIIEQAFSIKPVRVWEAITQHDQMIKWFFENIPDFKAEFDFYTEFSVMSGERNFFHQWKVTEVIPHKKISYQWSYKEYEGCSISHFEIFENKSGSNLRVSIEVLQDFPQDIPEFSRESGVMGWKYFIQGRLKEYLAKNS